MHKRSLWGTAALAVALTTIAAEPAAAQRTRRSGSQEALKLATLAPDGTSWTNVLGDLDKDLQKATSGGLGLRVYAGGVQGDEKLVLRKIALGQLHAGAFTGAGLGEIVPWVRLLELPFAFESSEEVDYVRSKLDPRLRAAFAEKGFILMGWVDVGYAYLYSKQPLSSLEHLRAAKPWLWEGDPLSATTFEEVGVKPTPLALPDVLTSLSTGLIDTVYVSPMACVGLQWFTKVQYVGDVPLAHGTGGLLVQKAHFDKLPADQQKALVELGDKHGRRLTEITRTENADAQRTLAEKGIALVPFDPTQAAELTDIGRRVADACVGKGLYTQAQLDEVRALIAAYRAGDR